MASSRSRIIRTFAFSVFLLMVDIIFNCGITPCGSFQVQPTGNSTTEVVNGGVQHAFFNNYVQSVLNRTRTLEEVIYSDLLNNIRNLIKAENNQSADSSGKDSVRDGRNGKTAFESRKRAGNKTNPRNPVNSDRTNVFLNGANKSMNKESVRQALRNVTLEDSEYLLGYSGNPFGSRRPISGLVEVSENDSSGRGIGDPRRKRSVLHLYNMVLCTTGCNPFAYKGYGCYCGFLGSGFVVDGIDSCCKMHDWCYNSAGCPMFLEYFIPYLWKCYHRQPLCAIDHGHYGGPGSCAQRLCECDRQLALCLRRYPCPSTKALCTSSPWRLLQNVLML